MPTAGSIPLTFPDKLYASGIMHELPSPVMLNPIMENNKVFEKNIRYAELISGKIQKGEIIFDKKSKVGEIISHCESMLMIMVKLEIEKNSILNTENAEIKIIN